MIFDYERWLDYNSEDLWDTMKSTDIEDIEELLVLNRFINCRIKVLRKWENQKERISKLEDQERRVE
jgi:hypothetical protein